MEVTHEPFTKEIKRLDETIGRLEKVITEGQIKTIQWVVGIFIGATVIISTIGGVYISAVMLRLR